MPSAYPDLDHVFIKYTAQLKLTGVGTFKIIDGATNQPVLTYNFAPQYTQDRSFVSLNPTSKDCPSCDAGSYGPVLYIKFPRSLLKGRWMYTFVVSDGFAVTPGSPNNPLAGYSWSVITPDVEAPVPTSSSPGMDQAGVPISSPDFSMTFSEDIVLDSTKQATLHTVSGVQVATLAASVPYGVIPATFTTKRRSVRNQLVLKTAFGVQLTPSTRYFIKIPKGLVKDASGNEYIGKTQCSGCDWAFTTATSQAPTVVGAPGSLCNNTIEQGQIAVTPFANSENVPTTTSAVSFRFCGGVTVAKTGFISVKGGEGDATVTGLDLSKPWNDTMTVSQTSPGISDTVTIDFASNALHPLTTYTVTVDAGTFISNTGEKNAFYQWQFTTNDQPPPIALKSTWPLNNHVYNHTKITYVTVEYNASVFIGKQGKITLYEDSGLGLDGFEKILSVDMSGDTSKVTTYKTSTTRRSAHEAPHRRGVSPVATTLQCAGSCVTTQGATVKLQVPKPGLITSGKRYQGSIEKGAVTGSIGQHGPAVTKEDWNFITMTPSAGAAFNNPPLAVNNAAAANNGAAASTGSSANGLNFAVMAAAMGCLLLGILGAAGMYVYMNKNKADPFEAEEHDPIMIDDKDLLEDSSDDESSGDEDGEAVKNGAEQKTGDGPGTAAKAYDGHTPVHVNAVPDCLAVAALQSKVMDVETSYARVQKQGTPESDDEESGDDESGEAKTNKADQKTAAGPGTAAQAPPETAQDALRGMLMEHVSETPETEILKADIKNAANGIKAIEDMVTPGKKVNKWKAKSAMSSLNLLIAKMAETGQELPAMAALHAAAKHNSDVTPDQMKFLVAQAWPEVTRLRLERAAKIESMKLLDAVRSFTSGTMEEKECMEVVASVASETERLGSEAHTLKASCRAGCLTAMVAHVKTMDAQDEGVAIHMNPLGEAEKPDVVNEAQKLVDEHKDFMLHEASKLKGGFKQLLAAIATIEKINGNPEEDLSVQQIEDLTALVRELSAPMIYLYAGQQAIAAPVLEKMLIACQRAATGESSAYYLQAVVEEIRPQVERIKEKETEAAHVCNVLEQLSQVLESKSGDKEKKVAALLEKDGKKMAAVLQGHKARYAGWTHETPMSSSFRHPVSKSAELACLSSIVSTCENLCARPTEDAVIHANTEIKKLYRPSTLTKGDAEKFARCLVAMERFGNNDEGHNTTAELEQKLHEGQEPLGRFRDDMRVNVTGISTAFDLCAKIISRSADDEEYFQSDPKLVEKFNNAVLDAWANVTTLQAERHANKLAKTAMLRVEAFKADEMTIDQFQADVLNDRRTVNSLLEEDKDLYNEQLLLKSLGDLQEINDPDAINVATRETKSQLENIETVQRHTEALKAIAASFKDYLNPETKSQAVADLKQHIQDYAEIVVQLQALDADGAPLRSSLITAALMCDGTAPDAEVTRVAQQVISPAVLQHCSAPKSSDLHTLMTTIKEIVDQQSGSVTVKNQVEAQTRATNGRAKVKDEMDSHRKRLTFRSRLAFKKRAEENIELRQAEKTGAEWDGFAVEDVSLKSYTDTRTPCEKAFDDFDRNKDSIVTINEVIEYLLAIPFEERPEGLNDINPFQKAKMRKRLENMDTDRDGNLSFDEFASWWESNNGGKK
jgi:uncharacterized protein YccT (UPF0319 family)